MAEIDVSSYRQPQPPSALDTAQKLQSLESGGLTINKQKLDLVNQGYGYLIRELNSLPPNATADDLVKVGQNAVNQRLIPPDMFANFVKTIPTDPKAIGEFKNNLAAKLLDTQSAINFHYGVPGTIDTGQTFQPVTQSPKFGMRSTGTPIQQQIPVTTPVRGPNNEPMLQGPTPAQAAPGTVTAPPGVNSPPFKGPLPVGPINDPRIIGPSSKGNVLGASVEPPLPPGSSFTGGLTPNQVVQNNFPGPSGPRTGNAPGVAEAEVAAAGASGQHLATDRASGANFQRDIFPLAQAIPALEQLGPKGTGPGTETINNLKSFIISNVPGINENDKAFSSVPTYDKAKKYLTDFVNQTGNSGTNDKLAAAFAGNPSVGISNAAAVDVAKSALALRRMKQAQLLEFENSNLPASQYSKWVARRNNELDPRAFGIDLMSDDAKKVLHGNLAPSSDPKAKGTAKEATKAAEREKFERSLELALSLGFITPKK